MVERIKQRCKELGVTIAQMERELGIGNGVVSKWGGSSKMPTYDRVVAVANYLGVSPDWIVYGTEDKAQNQQMSDDQLLAESYALIDRMANPQSLRKVMARALDKSEKLDGAAQK